MANENLFIEPLASELEAKRSKARLKHFLSYDCYNAIYNGSRVKCKLELEMSTSSKNGGMDINSVMAGRTGNGCLHCESFNGD